MGASDERPERGTWSVLACVVNISEGRDDATVNALVDAAGGDLLDLHVDPDHHRSVLTLVGEEAPRRVATVAVERIDIRGHAGVHPRIGAVDVVPFVPIGETPMSDAVAARQAYMAWSPVPCVAYGEGAPSLPEVRRTAPQEIEGHPTAGITAVGARPVLLAYNVWLQDESLSVARAIAAAVRSPSVRALGLAVGGTVQVSMNLIDPATTGPAEVYDAVADRANVGRAELVGLAPAWVLDRIPQARWAELDLDPSRTIEDRLRQVGATPSR